MISADLLCRSRFEMSGVTRLFSRTAQREPDTGKCPRHITEAVAMTILLPSELEAFVERELAGDRYQSREDLFVDAIRLLRRHRGEELTEADWFEHALEQFRAIVGLPPGWDSNDAAPPDPKLVQVAAVLLYRLTKSRQITKPHINPTRRGGIQFEWEAGARSLEVEIVREDMFAYFFQDADTGVEEEGQLSPDEPLDVVAGYFQRLTGSA
jgi:Arc/MetJ-type ribon-helix-helix transcriptional regulator